MAVWPSAKPQLFSGKFFREEESPSCLRINNESQVVKVEEQSDSVYFMNQEHYKPWAVEGVLGGECI